jgi:hypothetical protein
MYIFKYILPLTYILITVASMSACGGSEEETFGSAGFAVGKESNSGHSEQDERDSSDDSQDSDTQENESDNSESNENNRVEEDQIGGDSTGEVIFESIPAFFPIDNELFSELVSLDSVQQQQDTTSLLESIVKATRLTPALDVADFIFEIEKDILDGVSEFRPVALGHGAIIRVHECPEDGRLVAIKPEPVEGLPVFFGTFSYDNCLFNGNVLDGEVVVNGEVIDSRDYGEGVSYQLEYFFNEFSILANSEQELFLNAGLSQTQTVFGNGNEILSTYTNNLSLNFGQISQPVDESDLNSVLALRDTPRTIIETQNFRQYSTSVGLRANGNVERSIQLPPSALDISAERMGGGIEITFGSALGATNFLVGSNNSSDFPNTGPQLDATFRRDGFLGDTHISMRVDNGDPSSFDVIFASGDESINSFTVNWTNSMQLGVERAMTGLEVLKSVGLHLDKCELC